MTNDENFKLILTLNKEQMAKNKFEKYFFKLINYVLFEKMIENVSRHFHMKFKNNDERRNGLVFEPN